MDELRHRLESWAPARLWLLHSFTAADAALEWAEKRRNGYAAEK